MPDPADLPPAVDELALAVEVAVASAPRGRPREALSAFILAWRRQWPHTFARVFRERAPQLEAWADAAITDPNHYLKLARIAMAHLATVL